MFDMMKLMGKMKEMQQKVKVAQENMVHITYEAEAGAGLVKAKVNGKKQLLALNIDESLFTPDDKEMLNDLVVAAVNKALAGVDDLVKEEMKKHTDGLLPNLPGFDLNNIL